MKVLLPQGWKAPVGYANGIAARGTMVFVAGQVGWDSQQHFASEKIEVQFEQALQNIIAVLAEAGARPEHICRMTAYCCDKPAYLGARAELGRTASATTATSRTEPSHATATAVRPSRSAAAKCSR